MGIVSLFITDFFMHLWHMAWFFKWYISAICRSYWLYNAKIAHRPTNRHRLINHRDDFTLMTISIIIGDGYFGRGDLMFIASGLCWGLFSVLLRKWSFSAWHIMCGVAIWSAVIYSLIYAIFITPAFHTATPTHLAIQGIFHGIFVVIIATLTYAEAVAKLVSSKQVVSPT